MSDKKLPGCFKYGCIGCVSIVALGFGLIFLLGAIQVASKEDPNPQMRTAEQALPAQPAVASYAADQPETIEIGGEIAPPPKTRPGTLELDLALGDFEVRPGPADEPLRVIAEYDSNRFELEETFSEDGEAWKYRVKFGGQGGFLGMLFSGGGDSPGNRVEIIVPRGQPIRIVGEVGIGESRINLGGLWVEEFDIEYGPGDHFVEVQEPLPVPMRSFRSDSSMGEVEIRGLGDASPAVVEVEHGMGELFLDLQGAWRQSSEVDVSFSMGGCRIWVPQEARTVLKQGTMSLGESSRRLPDYSELPEGGPEITLSVRGSMGDLRIEH